jgi:hypothetical protein
VAVAVAVAVGTLLSLPRSSQPRIKIFSRRGTALIFRSLTAFSIGKCRFFIAFLSLFGDFFLVLGVSLNSLYHHCNIFL